MNKNVQLEWVSALRSGHYIQAEGTLNGGESSYCALGVLCSLYIQQNPGRAAWVKENDGYTFAETYGSKIAKRHDGGDLPDVVKHWAGLVHNSPFFVLPGDEEEYSMISVNDTLGEDFERIASRIEKGAERRRP